MNKLPKSMKGVVEKIKSIEITNLSPKPSLAGIGNGGERNTLGELFSAFKSGTKGTGNRDADIPPAFKQEEFASSYESRINQTPAQIILFTMK